MGRSKKMTRIEIAKIVLDAVSDADKQYYDMTGGMGVNDNGVEPFISAKIAQKLHRHSKKIGNEMWITLEEKFQWMLEYSNSETRGGLAGAYSGAKKVDVAAYRNSKLLFVVEVKRGINFSTISDDIGRINYLLNRMGRKSGSLKFGLMAGIARSMENKKCPKERMNSTLEKIAYNHSGLKVTPVPTKICKLKERFETTDWQKVDGVMPYCFLIEAK